MTPTAARIIAFAPTCPTDWARELAAAMLVREINTVARAEMFLAQCAHESAGFTRFHENLNYSAQGLMRTWPSRFPNLEAAAPYARNAEKTANHVYSNRLGNGNEASGDGWRYIGRGCIQLTGRENYSKAGEAIGYPLERYPTDVLLPWYGAPVACWYWQSRGLNYLADRGDFLAITNRINGGQTGQKDRERWLATVRATLADPTVRYA